MEQALPPQRPQGHVPVGVAQAPGHRGRSARLPLQPSGTGRRRRRTTRARSPRRRSLTSSEPGRGGLREVGPVRAAAAAHERLGRVRRGGEHGPTSDAVRIERGTSSGPANTRTIPENDDRSGWRESTTTRGNRNRLAHHDRLVVMSQPQCPTLGLAGASPLDPGRRYGATAPGVPAVRAAPLRCRGAPSAPPSTGPAPTASTPPPRARRRPPWAAFPSAWAWSGRDTLADGHVGSSGG